MSTETITPGFFWLIIGCLAAGYAGWFIGLWIRHGSAPHGGVVPPVPLTDEGLWCDRFGHVWRPERGTRYVTCEQCQEAQTRCDAIGHQWQGHQAVWVCAGCGVRVPRNSLFYPGESGVNRPASG